MEIITENTTNQPKIRTAEKPYRLFIDDIRYPVEPNWFVARNALQAITAVQLYGWPEEIAFDHDLGNYANGDPIEATEFIKWIYNYIEESDFTIPKTFKFSVHSSNPVGSENIHLKMNQLIKHYGE